VIDAAELEGAKILIGITREHLSGEVSQEQFVGMAHISDQESYCLASILCDDDEVREYPFDTRVLQKAPPGEYRLRSTGEIVKNPDYLMTWVVTEGQPEE
jgi:hypothetical protein